jgi:NitT/TauT family transport system permease protein
MKRWRNFTDPAIVLIVLALLWENAVDLFNIKRYLLPPLSQVLESFWANRGTLFAQSMITTREIVYGFAAALIGGIALGVGVQSSALLRRTLYPGLVVFQGIPKIALAPLMIMWLGYGEASKGFMAFLFAFFPILVSTMGGLAGTPANLIEHFRAIRASRWTTFTRLQAPSALPSIIDGCKTAMPLAVIGAIVGEFVGSENGLGHLLLEATGQARTDLMFAALLAICFLAGLLSLLVELAAKRVWWRAL